MHLLRRTLAALCPWARETRLTVRVAAITDGYTHVPITYQNSLEAGGFNNVHRDPFDRMLAAQSIIEGAALVTDDRAMKLFKAKCIW